MEVYSGKEPTFEEGDIFKATVPLVKVLSEMKVKDVNKMTVSKLNAALVGRKAQDKAQDKAHDEVSMKIAEFCKQERNIFEIMQYIGYKNRTRFRRDYIKPLVEKGILRMTIPDKPTSRNQKYVSNGLDRN